MFQKKTMNMNAYANGGDQWGNRFGGNNFSDSIDAKSVGLEKWKPSEGENLIDIIPYNATEGHPLVLAGKTEVGDPLYSLDYFVHRGIGPSSANITCLRQFGKDCPLCREKERLKAIGGQDNEKKAQDINAKRRVVYIVHDLKNNKYGYWDTGWKTVEENITKLARVTIDSRTNAPANVFDWENGMSLKFYGDKKKYNGKDYIEPSLFSFVERPPLSDEALSHSVDLSTTIKFTSAEDMEKLISGKAYAVDKGNTSAAPAQNNPAPAKPESKPVEAAPAETQPAPTSQPAQTSANSCPCGYNWGEADKHPECASCDFWEKCLP